MKVVSFLLFTGIGFLLYSCQGEKAEDPLADVINGQLDSLLANVEIEAVSIGVVKDGKTYKMHKGKLLDGKSPDEGTLYEIASLTKTFTGTLLAQAIVEKKVIIDEDIRNYLTGSFPNLAYDDQPITFRHLVTHQSGLPRLFPNKEGLFDNPNWDELPEELNKLQAQFTKEQFFTELAAVNLDTVPGIEFQYSNVGANLLGYLLEKIYQRPFPEILEDNILTPLGMEDTEISLSQVDLSRVALGQNANQVRMPLRADKQMNAEGGIITTVADMIAYLQFHLDQDNEVVSTAHQPLWDGKFGDFEAGLFWQIFKDGDQPDKLFQNGGAFGTSSWITLTPEQKTGIFIVTNVSGPNVHQKLSETVDKIMRQMESAK